MRLLVVLALLSCVSGIPTVADAEENPKQKIFDAMVGRWQGRWRSVRGPSSGQVELVVHEAKWPNVFNATVQFTGAGAFGTDPYIPSVKEASPAGDTFMFTGMRNGVAFRMSVTLQANGIQLLPSVPFGFPDLITPATISAELTKR